MVKSNRDTSKFDPTAVFDVESVWCKYFLGKITGKENKKQATRRKEVEAYMKKNKIFRIGR